MNLSNLDEYLTEREEKKNVVSFYGKRVEAILSKFIGQKVANKTGGLTKAFQAAIDEVKCFNSGDGIRFFAYSAKGFVTLELKIGIYFDKYKTEREFRICYPNLSKDGILESFSRICFIPECKKKEEILDLIEKRETLQKTLRGIELELGEFAHFSK